MMHNKSIYKKLCTATISLGLLFSIGQFAYAHDQNLRAAEQLAASNPTLENLKHLCSLYEIDIKQHYAKGENDEANEAEQELQKTEAQITSILSSEKAKAQEIINKARETKTLEDWQCAVDSLDKLLKMLQIAGDSSSLVPTKTALSTAKMNQATMLLNKAKTPDNYRFYEECCETFITLASDNKELALAVMNTKISVAMVRLEQAKTTLVYNKTPENYEILAKHYDTLADTIADTFIDEFIEKGFPNDSLRVQTNRDTWVTFFKIKAEESRLRQLRIMANKAEIPNLADYESLAQRWDNLATMTAETQKSSTYIPSYYKMMAEYAKIEQLQIMADNSEIPNFVDYEILAKRYDTFADTFIDEFFKKAFPNDSSRVQTDRDTCVTFFKIKAEESRLKQSRIMANKAETPNLADYESLAQRWDNLATTAAKIQISSTYIPYCKMMAEYAKIARLQIIADNAKIPNFVDYEILAKRYDTLADTIADTFIDEFIEKDFPNDSSRVQTNRDICVTFFKIKAEESRLRQSQIMADNAETPNLADYESLAQRWDNLATTAAKNQKSSTYIPYYKMMAEHAKIARLQIMADNSEIPNFVDYEILAKRYDTFADTFIDEFFKKGFPNDSSRAQTDRDTWVTFFKIKAEESRLRQSQIMADNAETPNLADYESLAQHWDNLATTAAKNQKGSTYIPYYKMMAKHAKIEQSQIIADNAKTPNLAHYEILAKRWDNLVTKATKIQKNSKYIPYYKIMAAWSKMMQAKIIVDNTAMPSLANYEYLAQCWDSVAELAKSHPKYSANAIEYKINAAKERLQQVIIMARNDETPENYALLAQRWDNLAKLAKLDENNNANAMECKINAAMTRAHQARMIANANASSKNYELLVQRCDKVIELIYKYNLHNESEKEYRKMAADAKEQQACMHDCK